MSNIKDQIVTLLKQRHHNHKVALEQEKDPRSKHAVDLIARIREDSKLIELIDSIQQGQQEADLEKEFDTYIEKDNAYVDEDSGEIRCYNGDSYNHTYDIYPIVRHFYELGLNARK